MELNFSQAIDFAINLVLNTQFITIGILVVAVVQYFFIRKEKRFSEISLDIINYLILIVISIVTANKFEAVNKVSKFSLFEFDYGILSVVTAFVLCDLVLYLFHYVEHRSDILWSLHQVHHSALDISLGTGLRIPWILYFITPFYYAPLIYLGYPPLLIMFCKKTILTYQYWVHQPTRKKDTTFLKWIFITPHIHSVHHLAATKYRRGNLGAMFSIWDHMFGTYVDCDEDEKISYGSGDPVVYSNVFALNFIPLYNVLRDKFKSKKAA